MPFEGKEGRSRRPPALGLVSSFLWLLLCGLPSRGLLDPGAACAEVPEASDRETVELGPVVVVAEERSTMESDADLSGFTDVIYAQESWRGFETVTDLLEHAAGVQVSRYGGREDFATVSVRGSSAGRVKILLDGVNLSRAQNQVVNLADLPLDAVERIEVYRGYTPMGVASSGAASVVRIFTKQEAERRRGISVSYGSFDTAKLSLQAVEPTDNGALSGYLTYRRSDGDFEFTNDQGTEQNPFDDVREKRRNNRFESVDTLASYRASLDGGATLLVTNNLFFKEEGVPGQGSNTSDRASLEVARNIASAVWTSGDGRSTLAGDLTWLRERFRDPLCPVPAPPGCSTLGFGFERSDNETLASSASATTSRRLAASHLLQAAVEISAERFDGEVSGSASPRRTQERFAAAVVVGDEIALHGGRLFAVPQIRHEVLWNRFEGSAIPFLPPDADLPASRIDSTDPRLGLRWEAGRGVTVKANAGTYFRAPSFGEQFGDDGFSKANPELRPEQGVSADAGIQWRSRGSGRAARVAFEYAAFINDADDLIAFVQTGQRVSKAVNVDEARVRGHELRLEAAWPGGVSLTGNYTHQRAENRSPQPGVTGKELPALPADEASVELAWRHGTWRLAYRLHHKGRRFFDEANLRPVAAQTVHDVSIGWAPAGSSLEVRLEGDNLGDSQVSDQLGFPVPGRGFYITVSRSWDDARD